MRFYTAMNPPPITPHPHCSEEVDIYKEVVDKNGRPYPKKMETENFHSKIQEAAKSSLTVKEFLIKYGLEYQDLPDAQVSQIIEDYTQVPTSYTETVNLLSKAQNDFSMLSPAQKQMFNNNVHEFLASAQNGTILDKLNLKKVVPEEKVQVALEKPSQGQILPSSQQVETTQVHNITEGVKYE